MAKALNLSRNTVRRCYENLRKAGQINSDGIKGTVVKGVPYINPVIGKLKGFTQEMQELGIEPSTQLIAYDVLHDRTIASIFRRPSTAKFLRLIRLRLGNGVPMTREVAWYDLTTAPNLENWDTAGSIYDFLSQHCGIELKWAEQSIEAMLSSEEESKVFGYENASPCLLLKRKSYALKDQLIEYVEGTFRGDAYTYRIKLKI
jgi:GntR family transcriptional regulator